MKKTVKKDKKIKIEELVGDFGNAKVDEMASKVNEIIRFINK